MPEEDNIAELNHNPGVIPIGGVIPYFGRLEHLDHRNWQLCDGSEIGSGPLRGKRTPDLRDMFLRGTADQFFSGKPDGEDSHTHATAGDLGGTFQGNGQGQTLRKTGRKFGWGDDDVHPVNEGDHCNTYEWDVAVSVNGTIATNPHDHGTGKNVPKHVKTLFIIKIG
jgi:hypothetical protein